MSQCSASVGPFVDASTTPYATAKRRPQKINITLVAPFTAFITIGWATSGTSGTLKLFSKMFVSRKTITRSSYNMSHIRPSFYVSVHHSSRKRSKYGKNVKSHDFLDFEKRKNRKSVITYMCIVMKTTVTTSISFVVFRTIARPLYCNQNEQF